MKSPERDSRVVYRRRSHSCFQVFVDNTHVARMITRFQLKKKQWKNQSAVFRTNANPLRKCHREIIASHMKLIDTWKAWGQQFLLASLKNGLLACVTFRSLCDFMFYCWLARLSENNDHDQTSSSASEAKYFLLLLK